MNSQVGTEHSIDVAIVGSGIMSATLAVMLKRLRPQLRISVFEAAATFSPESSAGWHNAGTGHAGLCELSYTPFRGADGSVDVRKAIEVYEQFEVSRQFWASCVRDGVIEDPTTFLQPVPHMSFVECREQVAYLASRYEGLRQHHFFEHMQFSDDPQTVYGWAPLLSGRTQTAVAATRAAEGTDVNFGALAAQLLGWLGTQEGCTVHTSRRVSSLRKTSSGWQLTVMPAFDARYEVKADAVFLGAGGGTLPLLQSSGIPEGREIGGFPIGGQWLVCDVPEVVDRHYAKVYGQALGAAPTMAVPHLDTRVLDGRRYLLFGPFAAWTTRFLHRSGRWTDLPRSVRSHNFATLFLTGARNLDLVRYLVKEGTQTFAQRLETLRQFYPEAHPADWKLIDAGIRVQAIRKTDGKAGIVHYGTEVITDSSRTLAALLGASPGASVSADIALQVVRKCFAGLLEDADGRKRMKEMVPTFDVDIKQVSERAFFETVSREASAALRLPVA